MSLWSAVRTSWRWLSRIILYTFCISLPVFIFPIIAGIQGGVLFHFWLDNRIISNSHRLIAEVESQASLSYWNVPGALSIQEFMDQQGPFHIPKLTTFNWRQKLGLIWPNEHGIELETGVDKCATFDGLMRNLNCAENEALPTQYWIYVTSLPESRASPWDAAFSTLLQQLYMTPLAPNTGIFYLDCASAGFLCGVWAVKYPSLVHITIEDGTRAETKHRLENEAEEEEEEVTWLEDHLARNYTYVAPDNLLLPMTVRVIELPLEDDAATNLLPRDTLPTPLEQLRTLILDPVPLEIVSNWYTWSFESMAVRRFQEYFNNKRETRGTWWYYFNEVDNWYVDHVLKPIFGRDINSSDGMLVEVRSFVFTLSILGAQVVAMPCRWVWGMYAWYAGLGWDGEPLDNTAVADAVEEGGLGDNMWDDMMGGFWDSLARNMSAQESEDAAKAAVTAEGAR
jgi:hypothetical protein